MRILVIEDDAETARYIAQGLREQGHVVDLAADGHEGLMLASGTDYDVLIIDRMLPRLDGLALLKMLRAGGMATPALLLTAMSGLEDRVQGLSAADDYLVKPFAFAELYARVGAITRRQRAAAPVTLLQAGDLRMDLVGRVVQRGSRPIALQPTEFRLLEHLLRHKGQVVTRTMLLEAVWDIHFDPRTNIVETHISRLRAKIDRDAPVPLIKTVRGAGYRIDDPP
ncbi:response regulator transcription factor [Thioalkalicoccus limnaeus]|uniref:Response regulator transcription factor n=1 Tax=Thioalkalicoccus limnaeus TaxID=120681 RepID=A0ABV4BGU9_9GAMM